MNPEAFSSEYRDCPGKQRRMDFRDGDGQGLPVSRREGQSPARRELAEGFGTTVKLEGGSQAVPPSRRAGPGRRRAGEGR